MQLCDSCGYPLPARVASRTNLCPDCKPEGSNGWETFICDGCERRTPLRFLRDGSAVLVDEEIFCQKCAPFDPGSKNYIWVAPVLLVTILFPIMVGMLFSGRSGNEKPPRKAPLVTDRVEPFRGAENEEQAQEGPSGLTREELREMIREALDEQD